MGSQFDRLKHLRYEALVQTDAHLPEELKDLPCIVGCQIPSEYLEFLAEYPDTGIFDGIVSIHSKDRLSGNHDGGYALGMLYGACTDKRYDIREIWKTTEREVIPEGLMLIGDNDFGNAFCLDLRQDSFGKVYYWDHEDSGRDSALHLISDDFATFISELELDS